MLSDNTPLCCKGWGYQKLVRMGDWMFIVQFMYLSRVQVRIVSVLGLEAYLFINLTLSGGNGNRHKQTYTRDEY